MKKIFLFCVFSFLLSCNKSESVTKEDCCMNFDLVLGFHIEDEQGNDLLDPNFSNSYTDIKIYSDSNLTNDITNQFLAPDGLSIVTKSSMGHLIVIHSDMNNKIDKNTFTNTYYLKLSESETDTILLETSSVDNGAFISKFSYNNQVVFDNMESRKNWNGVIIK